MSQFIEDLKQGFITGAVGRVWATVWFHPRMWGCSWHREECCSLFIAVGPFEFVVAPAGAEWEDDE